MIMRLFFSEFIRNITNKNKSNEPPLICNDSTSDDIYIKNKDNVQNIISSEEVIDLEGNNEAVFVNDNFSLNYNSEEWILKKEDILNRLGTYIDNKETYFRSIIFNASEEGLFPHEIAMLFTLNQCTINSLETPISEVPEIKNKEACIQSLIERGFVEKRLTFDDLHIFNNGQLRSIVSKANIKVESKDNNTLLEAINKHLNLDDLHSCSPIRLIKPTEKGMIALSRYDNSSWRFMRNPWREYSIAFDERYQSLKHDEYVCIKRSYLRFMGQNDVYDSIDDYDKNIINGDLIINNIIRVKNASLIYSDGEYICGEDLSLGEYYFWGDKPFAFDESGHQINYDEDKDFYYTIKKDKKLILEGCHCTPANNLIHLNSNRNDILQINHMYKCGEELPYGKYRFVYDETIQDYYDRKEAEINIYESFPPNDSYISKTGKYGEFLLDNKCKYVRAFKAEVWLEDELNAESDYTKNMRLVNEKALMELYRKVEQDYQKIIINNRLYFYVSINDKIAEILIKTYYDDCVPIKSNLKDDDTINYRFSVDCHDKEEICFVLFLLKTGKLGAPKAYNISLFELYAYASNGYFIQQDKNVINAIKSLNIDSIEKYDKKIFKQFEKIYPARLVSPLVGNPWLTYTGPLSPEFTERYYWHTVKYEKNYSKEYKLRLLKLAEQGLVNQRWKSEFSLYLMVKTYYKDAEYQYRADWLGQQSLDIFIPSLNVGIEYQGIQHYEAIDFFGGNNGLEKRKELDAQKRALCANNKIKLIEWKYEQDINEICLKEVFEEIGLCLPNRTIDNSKTLSTISVEKDVKRKNIEYMIYQYDKNGVFVAEFEKITEACVAANTKGVGKVINGQQSMAGGFYWKKVPYGTKKDCINIQKIQGERKQSLGEKRAVAQMDDNGNIIKKYESVSEASRTIGIDAKSIRLCAKGTQKHAGGFCWKYVD